MRLIDFASAGAAGTRYRSWLPVKAPPPAPAFTQVPPDAGRVPKGPVQFQWRGARRAAVSYRVEVSPAAAFPTAGTWTTNVTGTRVTVNSDQFSSLAGSSGGPIYWRVVSRDANGETVPEVPPAWFRVDPSAPPQALAAEQRLGPNSEIISHSLRGEAPPQFGEIKSAKFTERGADGTEVNGQDQMLIYAVSPWPEEDFTVSLRVLVREASLKRFGQVFSAWAAGMDDPLRIVVDQGKLAARVEAGGAFGTPGMAIEAGRWYAVAAVKRGGTLTLWVDGKTVGSCAVPEFMSTGAQDCALGGNPHFSGNEFLAARFADFRFYAKALGPEEIRALAGPRIGGCGCVLAD